MASKPPPYKTGAPYATPAQQRANAAKDAAATKKAADARKKAKQKTDYDAAMARQRKAGSQGAPMFPPNRTAPSYPDPVKNTWGSATDTLINGKAPAKPPKKVATPTPTTPTPTPTSAATQTPTYTPPTYTPPPKPEHVVVRTHKRAFPSTPANALAARSAGLNVKYGLPKATTKKSGGTGGSTGGTGGAGGSSGSSGNATTPAVDSVTAQINAAQLPQIQAIKDAQTESERAAKQQAANTSDYYSGLSNILKGIGPATQAGYTTAAANDAAFGKGFSTGLKDVQNGMQAEAAGLAGISGGTAPAPPGAGASDALYALGGYIPASTMNREGAAFGAAANLLPATSARQGADAITQIQSKQALDQKGFQQKFADLAAQVPGLRLQYQAAQDKIDAANTLAEQRAKQIKINQAVAYINATGRDAKGNLTPKARASLASALGYDPVSGKPTASTYYKQVNADNAAEHLSIAEQKLYADLYGTDANGNLTLSGRKAALAQWKAEHTGAKGALTKNQYNAQVNRAAKIAKDLVTGKAPSQHYDSASGDWIAEPGTGVPALANYQDALKRLMTQFSFKVAQQVLKPYYKAGQRQVLDANGVDTVHYGRPYLDINARLALEKAGLPVSDDMDPPTLAQVNALHKAGINYQGPYKK